jgi:hypothetical protein
MQDQPNMKAIENFIGSIDTTLPMIDHFRNAMRDALIYKWNSATRQSILLEIEDRYIKKEIHDAT